MKWLCVYVAVIILSEIKGLREEEVEEKIIPEAVSVNKYFLENCIKTLRNFDVSNKGDSDDILRGKRKIGNHTVEINNSSTAMVNKVTNLNATNKENYDKATAAECMKAFQLNINGDYWEQLNSIYKQGKRNLTSSLDKSTSNDAEEEISQTTYKNVATSNTKIKLEFPACPSGETIIVETLEEQYFPFSFFSNLLSLLQPIQFPLGILKDISQRRVPFRHLLLQVLKLEGPLVAWILLWGVLSLCIPCAVIAHSCRPAKNLQRLEDHSSGSSIEDSNNCNRRSMGFLLHFLLFVLLLDIILMMSSNEQLSKTITQSPERAEIIMEDLQSFAKNTEMQINFLTITSIETALDAMEKDMEDVEGLIGIPFQKHIGSTFGLERIFQILTKIRAASYDASKRVKNIMQTCKLAQEVARALEERLGELIPLLNNIHQQCSQRDRALCETLVSSGLDITFRPEEIFSDAKLKYLLHISSDAEFNNSLGEAENNFKEIPRRVALETELQRAEIRNNLQQRRTTIHKALRSLEDLSRSSISTIKSWSRKLIPILEDIASRDMWRYLTILGISIFLFVIWMCFMCGAPCGCENTSRTITYLNVGIALSCLVSLCLWIFGSAVLIVGVHGRNLICHSFYDPGYALFSELLDDGGLFYPNGGFFKMFLHIDQSLNVANVLRNAERNQSTYNTFRLRNIADVRALVNYENWLDIQRKLESFHVETKDMKILTIKAETFLIDLNSVSKVNLTRHRKKISGPITGKDLNAFLDQAYAVAKQTVDARTSTRMEKLIFKLRSIINSEYKSLGDYKDKILYEVTALEIILNPVEESTEYVLESLRLLQTSLDTNENNYAQMNVRNYVETLRDYLSQFKEHVEYNMKHNVAKLKPLWNIFYATRITICEQLVDALNAFSFSCFFSILLLIFLVPVTGNFIKHYRDINEDLLNSIIRRNASDEMSPNEEPDWSSPRTSGTPESVINEESAWASPRQSIAIDAYIPPPPRPPTDTRRDPSPRPALPTISGSRSPFSRYESLKLIERIARKTSGSSTTRSWI